MVKGMFLYWYQVSNLGNILSSTKTLLRCRSIPTLAPDIPEYLPSTLFRWRAVSVHSCLKKQASVHKVGDLILSDQWLQECCGLEYSIKLACAMFRWRASIKTIKESSFIFLVPVHSCLTVVFGDTSGKINNSKTTEYTIIVLIVLCFFKQENW